MRAAGRGCCEPASTIECSISEPAIVDVAVDRGVGADVGVDDARAGGDDRRARAPGVRSSVRALLDDHPALDLGVDQLPVHPRLEVLEHEAVGLEHVLEPAGVLPPALDDVRLDPLAVVDQGWIASVISSSPRAEGSIERAASKIAGPNM